MFSSHMQFDSTARVSVANDSGSVTFPCPKCGKQDIVRSKSSRQIVVKYTCQECGFEGPN